MVSLKEVLEGQFVHDEGGSGTNSAAIIFNAVLKILVWYCEEEKHFLVRIIMRDEARIHFVYVSLNNKSKKLKQTLFKKKIRATVFWEYRRDFLIKFPASSALVISVCLSGRECVPIILSKVCINWYLDMTTTYTKTMYIHNFK